MILFEEDWHKPENAHVIVHTSTTNQSFIDLHHILKKQGVKNNLFFLALHDRRLLHIDPYSPDLTEEQIIWISDECAVNPWYYFREIAPVPEGSKKNRFRANRANISLFWSFFNNCQYLLIQPRQTGKSYSTDTLMVYVLNFATGIRSMLFTKDRPLAVKNVIRLRKLFERMPAYLCSVTKKDSNNQETITVMNRGNYYNTVVAQDSPEDADKKGRGDTVEVRHCDEIAYCKNNFITIPVMGSAMDAARADAIKDGKFTGSIFTTTAGKKDSPEGKWAYDLFMESAEWRETYYDCRNHADFERQVRADSNPTSELAKSVGFYSIQGTFSHRQLGYSDSWLINNIVKNSVAPEAVQRDYLNMWTSGSEVSPFTTKQLQMISSSESNPVWEEKTGAAAIRWYYTEPEINYLMENHPIILGLDTSNNISKDSTTMCFVNATNLDIIGAADCNSTNLYQYAKWLADLMVKHPKLLIVPENKSSAQGIIDYLIEVLPGYGIDPFKRIFNTVVNERESNPRRFESMDAHGNRTAIANQYRPQFGYTTTGTGRYSRENLYTETLYRAIDIVADKIKDKRLVSELLKLVLINGRIDHVKGAHDDQVISWLLACWFIFSARNVYYYDIVKTRFLSEIVEAGKVLDVKEVARQREQEALRERIDSLYDEIGQTDDFFEFVKLEKAIKLLETKLTGEELNKVKSMSAIIDEMKERRKLTAVRSSPTVLNDLMSGLQSIQPARNPYESARNWFEQQAQETNYLQGHTRNDVRSLSYWLN